MRIALAQLNPTSGDIDGEHGEDHRRHRGCGGAGRRSARHAGDGDPGLLHWRSGRGCRLPGGQRTGAPAHRCRRNHADGDRRLHRSRSGGTQRQRHDPESTTPPPSSPAAASFSVRTSRSSPTIAISTTSDTSHPRAGASPSTSLIGGRHRSSRRVDLRGHVGRVLRGQAAAGARGARARRFSSTSTPRRSIPASATSAMRSSGGTSHSSGSRSSTSTRQARPTTARTSFPSTARALSTRATGGCSPWAGSSPRTW